jgi:hypothetical protein
MTFKDLKKRVSLEITQQQFKLFDVCKDKPFWIWNIEEHKQEISEPEANVVLTMSLDYLKGIVLISLYMIMRK